MNNFIINFVIKLQEVNSMNKKCTKYEELFISSDEDALKQHISECEECRIEHEKMEKVSSLLDEVKLHFYAKRKKRQNLLKVACIAGFLFVSSTTFGIFAVNEDFTDALMYGDTLTAEELGFPVDSYGLIMVDE